MWGWLQVLVLDEVDVLLGGQGAFAEEVAPLVARCGRTVFVTATLPEPMFLQLKSLYPGLVAAVGPNLHRISTGTFQLCFAVGPKVRNSVICWGVVRTCRSYRTADGHGMFK